MHLVRVGVVNCKVNIVTSRDCTSIAVAITEINKLNNIYVVVLLTCSEILLC